MKNFFKLSLIAFSFFLSVDVFAADFDLTSINYSNTNAIDLVFVGDGFTAAQQALFIAKATQAEGHVMNSLPFNTHTSDFNTYRMELNSNQSGVSTQGGLTKDSFLGTFLNNGGTPTLSGIPTPQLDILRDNLRKVFKKKVYVIIIMNEPTYAGAGYFPSDEMLGINMTTLNTASYRELIIHEFAHSFGDLADEYGGNCQQDQLPGEQYYDYYNKLNVTIDSVNDRKWDFLASPQYILGANYCNSNWYRSSTNGLMRSLTSGAQHNELGRYLINQRIAQDLEYNGNVTSYILDTTTSNTFTATDNVRIHADEVTFENNIVCDELYIAKGATLYMEPGKTITCNKIVKEGSLIYKTAPIVVAPIPAGVVAHASRYASKIRYGCKDTSANNYNRFSRHQQSLCSYGIKTISL